MMTMKSGIRRRLFRRLGLARRLVRSQRGISLIELLVGLAITGAIAGGISVSIFQTLDYNARNNARMIAVKEVENAIHYISRDVQVSQKIEPAAPDPDGFPLTLTWVEWDGTENVIIYTLNGGELEREHFVNSASDSVLIVARNLNTDSSATNCDYTDYVFSYRLTSTIDGYPDIINEIREGRIKPRSS